MVLVTGAKRFGLVGVLLAVAVPVNSWRVPEVATLNGSWNVIVAADDAVFETWWEITVVREYTRHCINGRCDLDNYLVCSSVSDYAPEESAGLGRQRAREVAVTTVHTKELRGY
jgi:hypothetical protein